MKEKTTKNTEPKYSNMLMQLVDYFDDQLPKELTFEDTFEIGIEAWNLANHKNSLGEKLYKKELKTLNYSEVINKMVAYKLEHFSDFHNIIIDFSTENDILQVKSQTPEEYFKSMLTSMENIIQAGIYNGRAENFNSNKHLETLKTKKKTNGYGDR